MIVPDREATAAWYHNVLGLTQIPGTEHWSEDPRGPLMISGDGGRVCLALVQGSRPDVPKSDSSEINYALELALALADLSH